MVTHSMREASLGPPTSDIFRRRCPFLALVPFRSIFARVPLVSKIFLSFQIPIRPLSHSDVKSMALMNWNQLVRKVRAVLTTSFTPVFDSLLGTFRTSE